MLRLRPVTIAVTVASAASTASRIIRVSEMFPRSSIRVAGETVSTTAERIPATGPASRSTTRKITRTVSVPSTIWGRIIAHSWNPKTRSERDWIQNAPGSLSMLTVPAGSKAA